MEAKLSIITYAVKYSRKTLSSSERPVRYFDAGA
jgi:hypothetical protein